MQDIAIFGAGGHAAVAIDTFRQGGVFRPVACLDRNAGGNVSGVKIVEEQRSLRPLRDACRHAFIAVGDPGLRERLAKLAIAAGFRMANAISPYAYVSPQARLGSGVLVAAGAVVHPGARIGVLAIVNTRASIDHDCRIGRLVHVAPGSTICGGVRVGARAWIGAGSTVIENVSLGRNVFVAAGAVVTRDARSGLRLAGVPARPMVPG
jgi:UDP-perosamine 4-acetyltransferase